MSSVLSTSQALKQLPDDAYLILVKDGKEILLDAGEIATKLQQFDQLKSAVQKSLDDRKKEVTTHLADTQLHHQPNAKDLGVGAFINQTIAESVNSQDTGLLRSSDLAAYLESEGYIKCSSKPFATLIGGKGAGQLSGAADESIILGHYAGAGTIQSFKNYVVLGARAQPISDNSVAIGNTRQQVHAAMPVASRADSRDFKTTELDLGLDFVLQLKPKRATMDLREDYIDWEGFPEPPAELEPAPCRPTIVPEQVGFRQAWAAYQKALAPWLEKSKAHEAATKQWKKLYDAWVSKNRVSLIQPDGSHARTQEQLLMLVQDIRRAANAVGSKYPGIIDQAVHGGLDIKAHRDVEMIPVLVKAVQDLYSYMHSDEYLDKIAARLKKS